MLVYPEHHIPELWHIKPNKVRCIDSVDSPWKRFVRIDSIYELESMPIDLP
jgi:hypothetical protein